MKIGILTYHFTNNVGSALQAFALQRAVSALGAECFIIDYQKRGWRKADNFNYLRPAKKKFGIAGKIIWIFFVPLLEYRRFAFGTFRKKFLNLTKSKYETSQQLAVIAGNYDKFIVGSDPVWNPTNVKFDWAYFLDFVTEASKKIAYAPSFGLSELPPDIAGRVASFINLFGHISVRESQGQDLIKTLTDRDVPVVLDPTFLLNENEWRSVAKLPRISGYIFVYLRHRSPSIEKFVIELSKFTGLEIVQVTGIFKKVPKGQRVRDPNPLEWLGYIMNAEYVVTNSFHGIAFSVNFNKQFFVEPIKDSTQEKHNTRIFSILDQFGLKERIISRISDISNIGKIDYSSINMKLDAKRSESIEYLKNSLYGGEPLC